jgi:sigma-B regulation protein RsbU (phosphoserine phosphatase)
MAAQIQKKLLPKANPVIEGYDIAGMSVPAFNVGGDYYDFIPVNDSLIALCLGDISGKGMPAALLMSNLQAAVRGQISAENTPKKYVAKVNTQLYNSTETNKFATFFFSILNPEDNEISFTNAGHDPPMLISKDNEIRKLTSGGPVIGFIENIVYLEEKITLNAGDVLVVYTDGITEAMNEDEEEFGEERLQELLLELRTRSASEIISVIIDNVTEHSGEVPQSDDITMIVVRKL